MSFLDHLAGLEESERSRRHAADLAAFQKLLARFGITAEPTELTYSVDPEHTLQFLNADELVALRTCPFCGRQYPTDGVGSPAALRQALQESLHRCQPKAAPPPANPAAIAALPARVRKRVRGLFSLP